MEANFKLFDECLNTIASNSAAVEKPGGDGIISNQHACISIVYNFLKGNVLDEKRRDKLQSVLFQYAVADFSASGAFSEYTSDNRCPDMTIEEYIETVFLEDEHYSVGEAYTGNDGYDIWLATLGLLREMLIVLRPNTLSKTQQKHFYNCLKKLVSNDEIETKNNGMIMKHGFMRNRDAYMSIIYNYFKTCKLSEHDREKLKEVLFNFAVAEFSSNGDFGDYKHDKRCPDLTIRDYVVMRFLRNKKITVKNADSGCGGYNIQSGTHALLREMLNTLNE